MQTPGLSMCVVVLERHRSTAEPVWLYCTLDSAVEASEEFFREGSRVLDQRLYFEVLPNADGLPVFLVFHAVEISGFTIEPLGRIPPINQVTA